MKLIQNNSDDSALQRASSLSNITTINENPKESLHFIYCNTIISILLTCIEVCVICYKILQSIVKEREKCPIKKTIQLLQTDIANLALNLSCRLNPIKIIWSFLYLKTCYKRISSSLIALSSLKPVSLPEVSACERNIKSGRLSRTKFVSSPESSSVTSPMA